MAIDKSKTDLIKAKYEELTGTLSDPAVASRPEEYTKYSKELAALNPQVEAIKSYEACEKEIEVLENEFFFIPCDTTEEHYDALSYALMCAVKRD